MSNIYIRLPISRCQYYRNRDAKHPLAPEEPIKFSDYAEEAYVLRTSIYNKVRSTAYDTRFFTQQEWKNMMRGKDPTGTITRLKRDPQQWLKYQEIVQIIGEKTSDKTDLFDYLCIKLPTEIFCIDDVRPVTPTWSIDKRGYNRLMQIINNDFKRSVIEWALATFDYCTSNGRIILRAQAAMLERYLMRYEIEPTWEEKDSLRRVIDRWMRQEHCNYTCYSNINMNYADLREHTINISGVEWT